MESLEEHYEKIFKAYKWYAKNIPVLVYECMYCHKPYEDLEQLKEHITNKHNKNFNFNFK